MQVPTLKGAGCLRRVSPRLLLDSDRRLIVRHVRGQGNSIWQHQARNQVGQEATLQKTPDLRASLRADDNLAEMRSTFHVAQGRARLGERKDAVDDRT